MPAPVKLRFLLVLFLSTTVALAQAPSCKRGFRAADAMITSSSSLSAVYGDFDEDGRTDVAMLLAGNEIVALNRGGHLFEPLSRETNFDTLPLVAAMDVNGDGHLDLVHHLPGTFAVALGNGQGSFSKSRVTSLDNYLDQSWRLADIDHDGVPDFIGFNSTQSRVTFTRTAPDSTFSIVGQADLGGGTVQSIFVTGGDFDGDGHYDAMRVATGLALFKQVERFAWNDGTYHFSTTDEQVDLPASVTPIDIDGDGAEELLAIDNGSLVIGRAKTRRLTVERIAVAPLGTRLTITSPVMLDVDGDGIRDLVFSSGTLVGVLHGTANKSFGPLALYQRPGSQGLVAADLDGDGIADFAPVNGKQGLYVLYGETLRSGLPNASRVYATGGANSYEHADVDGDGIGDLVATLSAPFSVQVLFGDANGTFARYGKPFTITDSKYSNSRSFAADYDGDGHADLAIAPSSTSVKPLLAFGATAGFDTATTTIDADAIVGRVSLGTSNALIGLRGDDVLLITVSSGRNVSTSTIYHRAAGATVSIVRTAPGTPAQIAVTSSSGSKIVTRNGDTWQENTGPSAVFAGSIASADLDGDGATDYVMYDPSYSLRVFFADGSQLAGAQTWGFTQSVSFADIDRDGKLDLVITSQRNYGDPGYLQVLRNAGNHRFEPYSMTLFGAASGGAGALIDDFDGDGSPDVLVSTFDGAEMMMNIYVTPRLTVALTPQNVVEGGRVKLVIHALSTDGFAIGGIYIEENGKVIGSMQPYLAYDLATSIWSSPPLTAGTHTYTVRYADQFGGPSETTVTFTVYRPAARRRAA